MSDRRMLVIDAEAKKKLDENKGDLSYSDFISYLIDSRLGGEDNGNNNNHQYATKEDLTQLEQSLREVVRSFLEFFLTYEFEVGKPSLSKDLTDLNKRLQTLASSTPGKSTASSKSRDQG